MKVRDLTTIAKYLSGMSEVSLNVQVKNADGTKQICDVKEVRPYSDALVLNIDTDFSFKSPGKFQEGQFIIHKDDNQDIIYHPHFILLVDEAERKYRLDNGKVVRFSEEDDYEPTVQISKEVMVRYYNKALEDVLDAISDKTIKHASDVIGILQELHK